MNPTPNRDSAAQPQSMRPSGGLRPLLPARLFQRKVSASATGKSMELMLDRVQRQLLEERGEIHFVINHEARVMMIAGAAERLFPPGQASSYRPGVSLQELFTDHPTLLQTFQMAVQRVLAQSADYQHQITIAGDASFPARRFLLDARPLRDAPQCVLLTLSPAISQTLGTAQSPEIKSMAGEDGVVDAGDRHRQMNESEQRLRAFLDNAPVMMGIVEVPPDDSDILHVLDNHAARDFLKMEPPCDEPRWAVADLGVREEARDYWVAQYRRAQSEGQPANFLFSYPARINGEESSSRLRWLNVTVSHLGPGEEGRQRYCYVTIDDTLRIDAEKALEQSYETFACLVKNAPFGVYLVDHHYRLLQISQGAERLFERTSAIAGRNVFEVLSEIWPRSYVNTMARRFEETLRAGTAYESVDIIDHPAGMPAIEAYHWRIERVKLPEAKFGVVCYFYDMTPAKRAELALRENEGRFRLVTELANIGVITCDYRLNQAILDATAARLFDLPAQQPIDRSALHQRFHPEDRERIQRRIQATQDPRGAGTMSSQHRVLRGDGTIRWVDACKRVYFSDERATDRRRATHSVIAVVDITERKEYEAELRAARRQAEAANRARGEFLANMSHEIRTPMTAILGYADMLRSHLQDPDNRQCVETIRRNGRFLLDIINDILDLSKIDAGKMSLEKQRVTPQSIIVDVVSLMNVRAEERSIELVAEIEGQVPATIETDGKRLRQVLLNLVGNAIKFTNEGQVRLIARFRADQRRLEFEVSDTGIGIRPEDLESLFQPFTQVDASHSRSFGGTGLGLAISRRLAKLLGGDIKASSRYGEGSTFIVWVDPGSLDDIEMVRPSLLSRPPTTASINLSLYGHYLIVDDRRDIRFLAQHLIEQAGGTVDTASDGREGVDKALAADAAGKPFEAILMDMQMPVMDGYAATREIRRFGLTTPVIALTANAMDGDAEECLAAGCTAFLTKPIDKSKLLMLLNQLSG